MGAMDRFDAAMRRLAGARGVASRQAAAPAGPVHLLDGAGRGPLPTLVFQHGLGAGAATQFVPLMVAAQRHFARVVAVDLPGHGLSAPIATMTTRALYDSVAHVLDAETSGPLVLVGNSLGGAVMLEYALTRPERVSRLVLTSPAGAPTTVAEREELFSVFAMRGPSATRDFFARMHPRVPAWAPLFAEDVRARFALPHVRALVDSFRDGAHFEPGRLATLRAPTLLQWGTADRLLPASCLAWWKRHLPATFEEPPVGHSPHFDAPVAFYRRLRAHAEA
jgi:pimeloyl-ACP methyl ester carboxylesterase